MSCSLPRRRLLIGAAVPGVLAGCFEDPDERNGSPDEGTDVAGGDEPSSGADETDGDGDLADDREVPAESEESTGSPDRVDPEAAGVVVTDVTITGVDHGGYYTTVFAEIAVENVGRFEYGLLELRADAYTTTPNSRERDHAGFEYSSRLFPSDDRFLDGTRLFRISIRFRRRVGARRASPEWYEVDAAVRRAEPSDSTE